MSFWLLMILNRSTQRAVKTLLMVWILTTKAIKLLAVVCDSKLEHNDFMNSRPKEDTNVISVPQPITAAIVLQESVAAIDGQSATLVATALMKSALDNSAIPLQVAEVANSKQK
jgi:hypothetical protein